MVKFRLADDDSQPGPEKEDLTYAGKMHDWAAGKSSAYPGKLEIEEDLASAVKEKLHEIKRWIKATAKARISTYEYEEISRNEEASDEFFRSLARQLLRNGFTVKATKATMPGKDVPGSPVTYRLKISW